MCSLTHSSLFSVVFPQTMIMLKKITNLRDTKHKRLSINDILDDHVSDIHGPFLSAANDLFLFFWSVCWACLYSVENVLVIFISLVFGCGIFISRKPDIIERKR